MSYTEIYWLYTYLLVLVICALFIDRRNKNEILINYEKKIFDEKDSKAIKEKDTGVLKIENGIVTLANTVLYDILTNYSKVLERMYLKEEITPKNIVNILNQNYDDILIEFIGTTMISNNCNCDIELDSDSILNTLKAKYMKQNPKKRDYLSIGNYKHSNIKYRLHFKYDPTHNTFIFLFKQSNANKPPKTFQSEAMFISKIAHEFKNPLIAIHELIETITKDSSSVICSEQTNQLNLIQSFTMHLFTLAKDMECYSEFQQKKKIKLSLSPVDVHDTINFTKQVAEGLIVRHCHNKVTFDVIVDSFIPKIIYTDQIRLRQILINLISNSIKFTDKGTIILHLSEEDEALKFSVTDTGKGLDNNQLKNIFLPFEKANLNNTHGAGLGLCIVKELSLALGEGIQLTSHLNHGSTFWFKIPLMNREGAYIMTEQEYETELLLMHHKQSNGNTSTRNSTPIYIERQLGKIMSNHSSDKTISVPLHSLCFNRIDAMAQSQPLPNTHSNNVKITKTLLVIDDDEFVRKASIRSLNSYAQNHNYSFEIIEATDGYEGLNYICNCSLKKIDLIICDENMKYCQGAECYNALTKLFNENKISKIPFVILSGNSYNDSYYKIKSFTKPLNEQILHNLLKEINL